MKLTFGSPWVLLVLALLAPIVWLGLADGVLAGRRRVVSTSLRAGIVACLVLALAGPRIAWPVDETATAFLVDSSRSLPARERARAEAWVSEAIELSSESQAAIVAFGQAAMLDRSARVGEPAPIRSLPGADRTDIASALRLGAAVLPSDVGRRLVLISDGRANLGDLERQLVLLKTQGVPVDVVPLAADTSPVETLVQSLDAPATTRVGQAFDLTAVVHARTATGARLQILGPRGPLLDEQVRLEAGENTFTTQVEIEEAGFQRFRALIDPDADAWIQNNEVSAFTVAAGPPRVLIVADDPAGAGPLMSAFESAEREPVLVAAHELPATLLGLAEYESVVLVDVPARRLPGPALFALEPYVRDVGKGIVMVGGESSFGSGGYRHTPVEKALPVEMEVRDKERRPGIAISFVIDKSGSMSGCDTCAPGAASASKIGLAKEAVIQASELLRSEDSVALVAFDGSAHHLWELAPLDDPPAFASAVGGLQADGGTNIQSGIQAALPELEESDAALKHLILLTDGWSDTGGYDALIESMTDADITLSIVAVGTESAPYLRELAGQGGGRFYPVIDAGGIPQIMVEETLTALGTYIVEEPFQPVPGARTEILDGLPAESLPTLYGYNGTTAKQTARVGLWSHLEDPVLAQWQYGLGRGVAWTSDMKRQWARAWLDSVPFERFALQVVDWTLPPPDTSDVSLDTRVTAGRADLRVRVGGDGGARDFLDVEAVFAGEDGTRLTAPLQQVGIGEYAASVDLPRQGAYLVRVNARERDVLLGSRTAGVVVPYSPEFADPSNEPVDPRLYAIASETGGRVLESPAQAFDPVLDVSRLIEIWPWLLAAAVVAFPFDVAVRRLKVSRKDVRRASEAVRELGRFRSRESSGGQVRRPSRSSTASMGSLFEARARARRTAKPTPSVTDTERTASAEAVDASTVPPRSAGHDHSRDAPRRASDSRPGSSSLDPGGVSSGEQRSDNAGPRDEADREAGSTLARLKAAKRRSREERG